MGNTAQSIYVQNDPSEEIIIRLYKSQRHSPDHSIIPDSKRTVFVSLLGLYQTWSQCPVHTLYPSIFILPIKKQWIYNPEEYGAEFNHHGLAHISIKDNAEFIEFIKLLKWKDSQKLLFCMLDSEESHQEINPDFGPECKENGADGAVASFWKDFNASLIKLRDPNSRLPYNPIPFFLVAWLKFPPSFKTLREIIYQSNPNTLNPVISYNSETVKAAKKHSEKKPQITGFVDVAIKNGSVESTLTDNFICFGNGCTPDMDVDCDGVWMVSKDYDEYDL